MPELRGPPLFFAPGYSLPWPGHVFPTEKYALTFEAIRRLAEFREEDWREPGPASRTDIERVHHAAYLRELEALCQDPAAAMRQYEIPISADVIRAVELHCGGTCEAVDVALDQGTGLNLGGGFHHAFAGHGEGFCFYNDIAIALLRARENGNLSRAVVVDCDVHQGNGTASIFAGHPEVATYSIHQENLYPVPKQTSDQDVGLPGGTGDDDYLHALESTLPEFLRRHPAELLVYVAGADPFHQDQLAQFELSHAGFTRRDEIVIGEARRRNLAIVGVLAGGYARRTEDVVQIHVGLYRALARPAC